MVFVLPALHPEVDHWDDNLIFNGLLAFFLEKYDPIELVGYGQRIGW